jgi:hypothetical protein
MKKINAVPTLLIAYAIMLLIAIFTAARASSLNECHAIEGVKFRSDREVLNFGDTSTMHPTISFRSGTFAWSESDMVISGTYTCTLGQITVSTSFGNKAQTVQINPLTGDLVWNGETYKRTSEPATILGQPSADQIAIKSPLWTIAIEILIILILSIVLIRRRKILNRLKSVNDR